MVRTVPGRAGLLTRAKLLQDVIALGALKGMQVVARKCGHDAGEHHLS